MRHIKRLGWPAHSLAISNAGCPHTAPDHPNARTPPHTPVTIAPEAPISHPRTGQLCFFEVGLGSHVSASLFRLLERFLEDWGWTNGHQKCVKGRCLEVQWGHFRREKCDSGPLREHQYLLCFNPIVRVWAGPFFAPETALGSN